jgi:hypothetical protein
MPTSILTETYKRMEDHKAEDQYTPPMGRELFLKTYGEEPEVWREHLDDLLDTVTSLGYATARNTNTGLAQSMMSPFSLYITQKNLKKYNLELADLYSTPNSHGLRSHEFKVEHEGRNHVLFAGCSVTFGEGIPEEYIWPKLVYDRISSFLHGMSGYFNVGINGGNHVDIIKQVLTYIKEHGDPDTIFINFPDTQRLLDFGFPKNHLGIVVLLYDALELYCQAKSIRLISFSHYQPNNDGVSNNYGSMVDKDPMLNISKRDTFYKFNNQDIEQEIYKLNSVGLPKFLQDHKLIALDGAHPGVSFHKAYANHAIQAYDASMLKVSERSLVPQDRSKLPRWMQEKIQAFDKEALAELRLNQDHNIGLVEELKIAPNSVLANLFSPGTESRSFFIEKCELAKIGKTLEDMYSFNSRGYRSEEFKATHDGLHILFIGCSVTFGQGVFLDDTWSKIVYNKLAETNKVSGYYNLSVPGATKIDVANRIKMYIEEFSMPDLVLINFPDSYRDASLVGVPKVRGKRIVTETLDLISDRVLTITWSSEYELDPLPVRGEFTVEELQNFKLDLHQHINFISYSSKDMNNYIDSVDDVPGMPAYLKYRAFDGAHPGTAAHMFYAELFLTRLNKDGSIIK